MRTLTKPRVLVSLFLATSALYCFGIGRDRYTAVSEFVIQQAIPLNTSSSSVLGAAAAPQVLTSLVDGQYLQVYLASADVKTRLFPDVKKLEKALPGLFMFSLIWSIGATSNNEGRQRWDSYLRNEMNANYFTQPLPEDGSIFDYIFDKEICAWKTWLDIMPDFEYSSKLKFNEITVPTKDTTRYTYLLDILLLNNKHCLVSLNSIGFTV